MIKLIKAFALASTLACGTGYEEPIEGEPEEFGTLEQGITGKVTPSFQFGTQTGSDRRKANRTTSGQVVTVPTVVNLKVCSGNVRFSTNLSPFGAARASAMRAELHGLSGFAFNFPEATPGAIDGLCAFCFSDGTCSTDGQDANIVIFPGPVGTSGTASNDIKNYAKIDFFKGNGSDNLTEGSGVVGNYKSHQMCRITIDEVDIYAKGTSTAQDQNLVDHAIVSSILACAGFGRHPTATGTSSLYTRAVMNANIDVGAISSGESCQANGYTLSSLTDYNNNATPCAND